MRRIKTDIPDVIVNFSLKYSKVFGSLETVLVNASREIGDLKSKKERSC